MLKKVLLKRIIQIIIVLIGVSFLTFLLVYLAPGDPATAMYEAAGIAPTPEMLAATRASLGLDKPFLVQYGTWVVNALHGNLGTSFFRDSSVVYLIGQRIIPTIQLALLSMGLMLAVSIPLGILCAVKQNKLTDVIIRFCSFFGMSMPNFWVGLMLMLIICVKLHWLPVVSSQVSLKSMILPAVTLMIPMASKYLRQTRTAVLEELSQDYVVGARARGVPFMKILFAHVLPNAMLPLITLLGITLGSLLGGTSVVEVVFAYPGLGNLGVTAVTSRDYPLTQGFVLYVAVIYMIINLLVDISYSLIDPRIRKGDAA